MRSQFIEPPSTTLVSRYRVSDGEPMTDAILRAFEQVDGFDVDDEPVLLDWIEPDAVDLLFRQSAGDPHVVARLWEYPVLLTRRSVTIYERD